jgi:hypothetical protein
MTEPEVAKQDVSEGLKKQLAVGVIEKDPLAGSTLVRHMIERAGKLHLKRPCPGAAVSAHLLDCKTPALDSGGDSPLDYGILIEPITVFLLTTAILILGICGKMPGEVLGTMRGGISGYVLGRSLRQRQSGLEAERRSSISDLRPKPRSSKQHESFKQLKSWLRFSLCCVSFHKLG